MKPVFKLFAFVLLVYSTALFGSESAKMPLPAVGVPVITSFSPTSAEVGDQVTITGTNFATTTGNTVVYLAGQKQMSRLRAQRK